MSKFKRILVAILVLALGFEAILRAGASDSPIFVTITTNHCSSCERLKPVVEELEFNYGGLITFVTLDVSSRVTLEESRQLAEQYGVIEFFNNNLGQVPKVGVLCPGGEKVTKVFIGETRIEVYKKALDELIEDSTRICSL